MVSAAEAAELGNDGGALTVAELGSRTRREAEGLECRRRILVRAHVTLADAGRDPVAQQSVQGAEVVRELGGTEAGLRRHHAAADVDTDRRRQDRILGRHDAADRRIQSEVGVRHEADRAGQDRQTRSPQRLLKGVVVELAGPRGQIRVDLLRHCSLSVFFGHSANRIVRQIGSATPPARPRSSTRFPVPNTVSSLARAGGERQLSRSAYEAGAQPPEDHRRSTPDTIRTCTRWVWASCLYRLGYGAGSMGGSTASAAPVVAALRIDRRSSGV